MKRVAEDGDNAEVVIGELIKAYGNYNRLGDDANRRQVRRILARAARSARDGATPCAGDWEQLISHIHFLLLMDLKEPATDLLEVLAVGGIEPERVAEARRLMVEGRLIQAAYQLRSSRHYDENYPAAAFPDDAEFVGWLRGADRTATLVDLACGSGRVGRHCRGLGYAGRLIGVDFSTGMLGGPDIAACYDESAAQDVFKWLEGRVDVFEGILAVGLLPLLTARAIAILLHLCRTALRADGWLVIEIAPRAILLPQANDEGFVESVLEREGFAARKIIGGRRSFYFCRAGRQAG